MAKKKTRLDLSAEGFQGQFQRNAFGAQLGGLITPESPPPDQLSLAEEQASHTTPLNILSPLGPKRVLRLALIKKGRGGKMVTTLTTLEQSDEEARDRLVSSLSRALGCRGWREETLLYFQGDQRDRITHWVHEQD